MSQANYNFYEVLISFTGDKRRRMLSWKVSALNEKEAQDLSTVHFTNQKIKNHEEVYILEMRVYAKETPEFLELTGPGILETEH